MHWIVRGILGLWALFFGWTGLQGLIAPDSYVPVLGIILGGEGTNTLRADLSSFFILSALCAGWSALRPGMFIWLLVPIGLFGLAFSGRVVGLMLGDAMGPLTQTSMLAEAVSVVLLATCAYYFSRLPAQYR